MLDHEFVSKFRISILAFLFFAFYAAVGIRLWTIQVLRGDDTREKVSSQYIRKIRIPAVRGRILTADGVPLADNRASYNVIFHLSEMRSPSAKKKTVDYIYEKIMLVREALGRKDMPEKKDVAYHITHSIGLPMTVYSDLNQKELARAAELSSQIPGMDVICEPVRIYPHGKVAGHLIGYVRRDDPASADDRRSYSYYVPDLVGKSGLELACDFFPVEKKVSAEERPDTDSVTEKQPLLRGTPGKKMVIVDHRSFIRKTYGPVLPAENGKSLILTLNYRAQLVAESLLEGVSGSIVVMESNTGKIVAMASSPAYAPDQFYPSISAPEYKKLLSDPGRPLFNKTLFGCYSPGSIIKPVMGTAIIASGVNPYATVDCDGYTPIGEYHLKCWIMPLTGGGHGPLDLIHALMVSCNDYFATSGLRLGVDRISKAFAAAGIGFKTGFILPEASGRLPYRKIKKTWTAFDTALISIGQGEVLVTPLQAAVYISAVANGGSRMRPLLVDKIVDCNDNIVSVSSPEVMGQLAVRGARLAPIHEGMNLSVNDPDGGSRLAQNTAIKLYGKTGTAEMGSERNRYKNTWFAGFGTHPKDGKTYTIIVFVEHGRSGGRSAAPLAAGFFEEWTPE